jgi:hypothetical protein
MVRVPLQSVSKQSLAIVSRPGSESDHFVDMDCERRGKLEFLLAAVGGTFDNLRRIRTSALRERQRNSSGWVFTSRAGMVAEPGPNPTSTGCGRKGLAT